MLKRNAMKTIRLVPLVLAGLCGYLHTVINRRFDDLGGLMSQATGDHSLMDAPNNMLSSMAGGGAPSTAADGRPASLQSPANDGSSTNSLLPPIQQLNVGKLQGPAADLLDTPRDNFDWKAPPEEMRVMAGSDEYTERLLQFTMNLLPNHDPTASKGNEEAAKSDNEVDDVNNPKPYNFNEIDMIVPASGQDDRLILLAENLGVALRNFNSWYQSERIPAVLRRLKQEEEDVEGVNGEETAGDADLKPNLDLNFRLLVTRYPQDEQKTEADFEALVAELSEKTSLPKEQIKLVRVGQNGEENQGYPLKFNRAHARNVLHQNACDKDGCIVTAFDVDMQVLPIFFHRALQSAIPHEKAYFPIVFSEFNPLTVQLVQDFLNSPEKRAAHNQDKEAEDEFDPMLEPFSRHRGLWRDFGYGMYVLAGSDAQRFHFNEQHQGWGHEDNDFYKLVHNNMRVDRHREHGLIHAWHTKNCDPGKDIITQDQWIDCLNSRDAMEGSALGLLLRPPIPTYKKEDFPGVPKQPEFINTKSVPHPDNDVTAESNAPAEEQQNADLGSNEDKAQGGDDQQEGDDSAQREDPQQQEDASPENDNSENDNSTDQEEEADKEEEQQEALQTNLRRRLEGDEEIL